MDGDVATLSVDKALLDRLQALAEGQHRSTAALLHEALEDYVHRAEREEAALLADTLERLADFEATGLHLTHDEVRAWMQARKRDPQAPMPPCHT